MVFILRLLWLRGYEIQAQVVRQRLVPTSRHPLRHHLTCIITFHALPALKDPGLVPLLLQRRHHSGSRRHHLREVERKVSAMPSKCSDVTDCLRRALSSSSRGSGMSEARKLPLLPLPLVTGMDRLNRNPCREASNGKVRVARGTWISRLSLIGKDWQGRVHGGRAS